MNEIDKMRNSQLADMEKPEIQASFIHAKKLVAQLRMMSTYDDGFREVLEELVPGIPLPLLSSVHHFTVIMDTASA